VGWIFIVATFLENTTVKEFRKSANICQSYKRIYSGTVLFDSRCTCWKNAVWTVPLSDSSEYRYSNF